MKNSLNEAFVEAIRALESAFETLGVTGVIIGGAAVSLLAVPRYTEDLDALILFDNSKASILLNVLHKYDFEPRFDGMADLALRARMVTVLHVPTNMVVDIALGCMPFEEEVEQRSKVFTEGDFSVRLPSPEDLVILKAIAFREKDKEDIRRIAEVHPNLDRVRIKKWVGQYGELLETPGLWSEIEALLESANKGSH